MCWHKWTKWKDVGEGKQHYYTAEGRTFSRPVFIQQRECEKCGKKKINVMEIKA